MNILSIQSWVAYGHVGNASAVFPLQRLGAQVWSINTVQFSNHTGYGHWTGQVYTGEAVRDLIDGIAARDVLRHCDAVLSGYMGDAAIGAAILHAVARVRQDNPQAIYCCDPVIGDVETGVYVREGIEAFLRDHALPQADIATPNRFELERLTGLDCGTLAGAKQAVTRLAATMRPDGLRCVLLTSLETEDTPGDHLDLLVGEGGTVSPAAHAAPAGVGEWRRRHDRRAVPVPSHQHAAAPPPRWRQPAPPCMGCCGAPPRRARAKSSPSRRRTSSWRPPCASPRNPAECRSAPHAV